MDYEAIDHHTLISQMASVLTQDLFDEISILFVDEQIVQVLQNELSWLYMFTAYIY